MIAQVTGRPGARRPPGRLVAVLLLTGAALVAVRAADTSTPLIDAVKAGDRAEVHRLIARKADVNASEPDGTTALHWAVRAGDRETVTLLLRQGAKATAVNRYNVTQVHASSKRDRSRLGVR